MITKKYDCLWILGLIFGKKKRAGRNGVNA
jgi:hypothetical protein